MVNTHPALSPVVPGHARRPRTRSRYGVKVTGATLFVVDAGVDTGPIVAQVAVPVEDDDTVGALHERIKVAERAMLVDAVGPDGPRRAGRPIDGHARRCRMTRTSTARVHD